MNIGEKVAYLKGLAEGLEISSDSKNGRILKGILDVLEDIAASVQTLEDENETLEDYITEIDEDLGELEKDFTHSCKHKGIPPPHLHKHKCHKDSHFIIDDDLEDPDNLDGLDDLDDLNDDDLDEFDDDYYEEDTDEDYESEDNEILDGVVEIKCPGCGKHIFIETDELLDSDYLNCPKCGAEISAIETSGGGCSCEHCGHSHGLNADDKDDENVINISRNSDNDNDYENGLSLTD